MQQSATLSKAILITIALVTLSANADAMSFQRLHNVEGPVAQQPNPNPREVTASLVRSVEDETITLNVIFPENASRIRVSLFNMLGKLIQVHPVTSVEKGAYAFRFRTAGLPTGPYIVVLELELSGQRIVNKLMLSR